MSKRKTVFSLLIGLSFSLSAVELIPTQQLLASYLEKDSDLKKLAIELQKTKLSYESTKIDEGFDINLSTGTMKVNFGSDGTTTWSVSPKITATVPQFSNLGVTLSSEMGNTKSSSSTSTTSSSSTSSTDSSLLKNTSIKLSADILSSTMDQRNYNLLTAERNITIAERNVTSKALEKEKSFYNNLSSILKSISSIISLQQDYYDDKISFEKIKAQGYAKTSSSYKSAEMKVLSDEHDIEKQERSLANDYKIFYLNCGQDIEITDISDYMSLIPSDIEQVEALDIHSFNPDDYTETESALWTNKINTMKRNLDKVYSLGASAGFTFNNTNTSSNSVDVGVNGSYGGLGADLGLSLPVSNTEKSGPSVNLTLSVDPNTFRKNKITVQTNELNEQEELMAIDTARINFGDKVTEMDLEKEDILWERSTNDENYATYEAVEKDMQNWYKQGIITESEYLSAKVDRQNSYVTKITNYIDMIVYNAEIKALFVDNTNSKEE